MDAKLGSDLTERYKILAEIGKGTFGKVLECWDRKHKERVAVKVVRDIDRHKEAAEIEIQVLKKIASRAEKIPEWKHACIELLHKFEYHGHVCMSFPLYGLSLYDFIRKNHYKGFPPEMVRQIGFQLISSLAWIHAFDLIHTDLKPENILFRHSAYHKDRNGVRIPDSSEIVLIDFGSATFEDDHHTAIVSTRHYRAPEIIIGSGWSYECDIWSFGCIMCELLVGDVLFSTHENLEHLALMQKLLGPMPEKVIREAKRGKKYFHLDKLLWPVNASSRESVQAVADFQPLKEQLGHDATPEFISMVEGCLKYSKRDRFTAEQCLLSPYFEPLLKSGQYRDMIPPTLRQSQQRRRKGQVILEGGDSPL